MTAKRINKELEDFKKEHDAKPKDSELEYYMYGPDPDDDEFYKWTARVWGPKGSPYEGTDYHLTFRYSESYPYIPPHISVMGQCFHPSFYNGKMHIDYFAKGTWKPNNHTREGLKEVFELLKDPTKCTKVLNETAYDLMMKDPEEFRKTARRYASRFFTDIYISNHPEEVKRLKDEIEAEKEKERMGPSSSKN